MLVKIYGGEQNRATKRKIVVKQQCDLIHMNIYHAYTRIIHMYICKHLGFDYTLLYNIKVIIHTHDHYIKY